MFRDFISQEPDFYHFIHRKRTIFHYISDNQIFGYTLDILSRQLGHVPKRKLRVTPRFGQRYYGKDDFWVICPFPVRMTGSAEDQQKSLMTDKQLRLNSLLHTS